MIFSVLSERKSRKWKLDNNLNSSNSSVSSCMTGLRYVTWDWASNRHERTCVCVWHRNALNSTNLTQSQRKPFKAVDCASEAGENSRYEFSKSKMFGSNEVLAWVLRLVARGGRSCLWPLHHYLNLSPPGILFVSTHSTVNSEGPGPTQLTAWVGLIWFETPLILKNLNDKLDPFEKLLERERTEVEWWRWGRPGAFEQQMAGIKLVNCNTTHCLSKSLLAIAKGYRYTQLPKGTVTNSYIPKRRTKSQPTNQPT